MDTQKKILSRIPFISLIKITQLLIGVIALSSCIYRPNDIYYRNILHPDLHGAISLNNYDQKDTIYLLADANFQFNVSVDNPGTIKDVQVIWNNQLLATFTYGSGSFSLGTYLKTGIYEMKILFHADPHTGSLANQLGSEELQQWRKWIVKIDADPPPIPIFKFSNENGFLKISWTPFTKPNFDHYTLSVQQNYNYKKTVTITDATRSYWIDSSFVGGYRVDYAVTTYSKNANAYGTGYYFDGQYLSMTSYSTADSTAKLIWYKSKFAKALKEYAIYENSTLRASITVNTDTTFSLKLNQLVFGRGSSITIKVNPNYNFTDYPITTNTWQIENPIGVKPLNGAPTMYFNSGINALLGIKDFSTRICIYNSSMRVIDSLYLSTPSVIVPYTGNFFYTRPYGAVAKVDLVARQGVKIDLSTIIGFQQSNVISGTSNQWVSYTQTAVDGTTATIYDWSTNTSIYSKKTMAPNKGDSPWLADDGRFVLFSPSYEVNKISGGALQLVGTLSNPGAFVGFRPDNTDEMIFNSSGNIAIYNSNDLSLKRTIPAPGVSVNFGNYDPASRNLLFEESNADIVYLVNIDTQQVKSVKAIKGNRLVNGILFSSNYYYLKVL